jgi:peroxiredoxin
MFSQTTRTTRLDHRDLLRIGLLFLLIPFGISCSTAVPPIDELDALDDTEMDDTWSDPDAILFNDDVKTNHEANNEFDFTLSDLAGNEVDLKSFRGKKNVVLVVTRGVVKPLCPYCLTQTSRLVVNRNKFEDRNTEVLVVIPGEKGGIADFTKNVRDSSGVDNLELKIVLDEDLSLVNRLAISADLAKPSTYILDQEGKLRFAYVGKTTKDRPSLKAMLNQLDMIQAESSPKSETPAKTETSAKPDVDDGKSE